MVTVIQEIREFLQVGVVRWLDGSIGSGGSGGKMARLIRVVLEFGWLDWFGWFGWLGRGLIGYDGSGGWIFFFGKEDGSGS